MEQARRLLSAFLLISLMMDPVTVSAWTGPQAVRCASQDVSIFAEQALAARFVSAVHQNLFLRVRKLFSGITRTSSPLLIIQGRYTPVPIVEVERRGQQLVLLDIREPDARLAINRTLGLTTDSNFASAVLIGHRSRDGSGLTVTALMGTTGSFQSLFQSDAGVQAATWYPFTPEWEADYRSWIAYLKFDAEQRKKPALKANPLLLPKNVYKQPLNASVVQTTLTGPILQVTFRQRSHFERLIAKIRSGMGPGAGMRFMRLFAKPIMEMKPGLGADADEDAAVPLENDRRDVAPSPILRSIASGAYTSGAAAAAALAFAPVTPDLQFSVSQDPERPGHQILFARSDQGVVLGEATFNLLTSQSMRLAEIKVLSAREGVGELLFRELVRIARERGKEKLTLSCKKDNFDAQQFFKKMGERLGLPVKNWISGEFFYAYEYTLSETNVSTQNSDVAVIVSRSSLSNGELAGALADRARAPGSDPGKLTIAEHVVEAIAPEAGSGFKRLLPLAEREKVIRTLPVICRILLKIPFVVKHLGLEQHLSSPFFGLKPGESRIIDKIEFKVSQIETPRGEPGEVVYRSTPATLNPRMEHAVLQVNSGLEDVEMIGRVINWFAWLITGGLSIDGYWQRDGIVHSVAQQAQVWSVQTARPNEVGRLFKQGISKTAKQKVGAITTEILNAPSVERVVYFSQSIGSLLQLESLAQAHPNDAAGGVWINPTPRFNRAGSFVLKAWKCLFGWLGFYPGRFVNDLLPGTGEGYLKELVGRARKLPQELGRKFVVIKTTRDDGKEHEFFGSRYKFVQKGYGLIAVPNSDGMNNPDLAGLLYNGESVLPGVKTFWKKGITHAEATDDPVDKSTTITLLLRMLEGQSLQNVTVRIRGKIEIPLSGVSAENPLLLEESLVPNDIEVIQNPPAVVTPILFAHPQNRRSWQQLKKAVRNFGKTWDRALERRDPIKKAAPLAIAAAVPTPNGLSDWMQRIASEWAREAVETLAVLSKKSPIWGMRPGDVKTVRRTFEKRRLPVKYGVQEFSPGYLGYWAWPENAKAILIYCTGLGKLRGATRWKWILARSVGLPPSAAYYLNYGGLLDGFLAQQTAVLALGSANVDDFGITLRDGVWRSSERLAVVIPRVRAKYGNIPIILGTNSYGAVPALTYLAGGKSGQAEIDPDIKGVVLLNPAIEGFAKGALKFLKDERILLWFWETLTRRMNHGKPIDGVYPEEWENFIKPLMPGTPEREEFLSLLNKNLEINKLTLPFLVLIQTFTELGLDMDDAAGKELGLIMGRLMMRYATPPSDGIVKLEVEVLKKFVDFWLRIRGVRHTNAGHHGRVANVFAEVGKIFTDGIDPAGFQLLVNGKRILADLGERVDVTVSDTLQFFPLKNRTMPRRASSPDFRLTAAA